MLHTGAVLFLRPRDRPSPNACGYTLAYDAETATAWVEAGTATARAAAFAI